MRTILLIIEKEFKTIFRDRFMLPVIFVMPFVQLLILVHAATFEMKNIDVVIVDQDLSGTSRQLTSKFEGSPFFRLRKGSFSMEEAQAFLLGDQGDMVLHIPRGFEKHLVREGAGKVQLLYNAIDGTAASLSNAYTASILADYNREVAAEWLNISEPGQVPKQISVSARYWYNPEMNYKTFMVPGILVLLITVIGWFLSAMNTVREKEIGTIEQINVTPIKKFQFVAGKLVPFWLIAMGELAFGLLLGRLLFDVPVLGSLVLLFASGAVYLLAVLGIGLLVANVVQTQQQAMFISWFFLLVFILMSGLFTPIESMPDWVQQANRINPIAYFIKILRMIMLKGSGFSDILPQFASLSVLAVGLLSMAVWRYKKVA